MRYCIIIINIERSSNIHFPSAKVNPTRNIWPIIKAMCCLGWLFEFSQYPIKTQMEPNIWYNVDISICFLNIQISFSFVCV